MIHCLSRLGIALVMMATVCAPAVADSAAEREGLSAIARDLDLLSEAVRRLGERSAGSPSNGGSRYRFDNLRTRINEIEDSIRLYLRDVESEPRGAWRIDVNNGTLERVEPPK